MTTGAPGAELQALLDINGRMNAILSGSHELAEYRQWLAQSRRAPGAPRDYLFTRDVPRFEPRRADVPLPAPGLRIEARAGTPFAVAPAPSTAIELAGLTVTDAHRLLDAMDGQRCLLEVQWHAGVEPGALSHLLRACFGRVIFAPAAAAELEDRLAGVELCRFPSSPYGIDRTYWENMIAVRERFRQRADQASSALQLLGLLRELHVIALLGPRLDSFYKPASPGADRAAPPGALLLEPPRLKDGADCAVFLSGPRVNASLIGGKTYHHALASSVGDEEALAASRTVELDGLEWGGVVLARGEGDAGPAAWFCPPRPMVQGHLEWLADALSGARAAASAGTSPAAQARSKGPGGLVAALARWHWGFVRLHPFHCANQSLAMNLANALLQAGHGAGIPHLLLDQLALRFTLGSYQRLFARAVAHWSLREDEPTRRLSRLLELRARLFALLESTSTAGSQRDGDPLAAADVTTRQAALLTD